MRHQHQRTVQKLISLLPPKPRPQYRTPDSGSANGAIIAKFAAEKRDYFLHATKGFRSYRVQS